MQLSRPGDRALPSLRRSRARKLASIVAPCSIAFFVGQPVAASTQAQPPDGVVESFDAAALTALPRNAQARAAWPAWRRGVQAFHWYNIPDSALSAAVPATPVPGQPRNRINAWNGLAADRAHSRLYSAANGGHGDYSGNEVCEIDLSADKPKWRMLREPTPAEYIVRSLSGDIHDYYRDDRPASTHTYYALHFLASRNAVFKFSAGSLWGSGGQANWKTDAFSLKNNDWHPPGTWPEVVPGSHRGVTARAICADPYSDEVYVAAPGEIRRFDPRRGEYEILAKWPNNSSSVSARPCAIDVERKRIVFFGDAYRMPDGGLLYDIKTNELREIRFSGANVADVLALKYNAAWYDERSGRFLLKTRKGADLYSVDPLTFQVAALETFDGTNIPDAANGVHTRWQWLPALGGYAYYPEYRSGIWFLATE